VDCSSGLNAILPPSLLQAPEQDKIFQTPASLKNAKITKVCLSGLRDLLFDFSEPERFPFFGMLIC
jgi:hypothetical protein